MRTFIFLSVLVLVLSCRKKETPIGLESAKAITYFNLKKADRSSFGKDFLFGMIDTVITAKVPNTTNRNGLIAEINHNGKSMSPASGIPQDFSVPVKYTVTARDGSTQVFTVYVIY